MTVGLKLTNGKFHHGNFNAAQGNKQNEGKINVYVMYFASQYLQKRSACIVHNTRQSNIHGHVFKKYLRLSGEVNKSRGSATL